MAKYINIKTVKPPICGRAPLVFSERHSDAAKTARYYRYQLLFNHYHPTVNRKSRTVKPVVQQLPVAIDTVLKPAKIKWLETASQWIGELFTREKTNQEVLSGTA